MSSRPIARVRRLCLALGKRASAVPTFFVHKKAFGLLADNHHGGHVVLLTARHADGADRFTIRRILPVALRGPSGPGGVELAQIGDEELPNHIGVAGN